MAAGRPAEREDNLRQGDCWAGQGSSFPAPAAALAGGRFWLGAPRQQRGGCCRPALPPLSQGLGGLTHEKSVLKTLRLMPPPIPPPPKKPKT